MQSVLEVLFPFPSVSSSTSSSSSSSSIHRLYLKVLKRLNDDDLNHCTTLSNLGLKNSQILSLDKTRLNREVFIEWKIESFEGGVRRAGEGVGGSFP